MKWYLHNSRLGARYAFFIPSRKKFIGSWHALMATTATFIVAQWILEFGVEGKDAEISYSWYRYHACMFGLVLFTAFVIGYLARKRERILDIAVAFLNSYYFIFLLFALVQILFSEGYHASKLATFFKYAIPVWGFAVMLRIVRPSMDKGRAGVIKCVVSGLLAAGMLYVLNSQIYFTRYYYAYGVAEEVQPSALDRLTSEEISGMQAPLRKKALEKIAVSKEGETDIYALTLGTYSYQDVFMRDANYAAERLKKKLGVKNIVTLINNKQTVETVPLADATNLKAVLGELSMRYMQPKEDIALIYLTSHGGQETGLSVNLGYQYSQMDLTPERLAKILKESGIQNKIIIISACYSGVFVPALKDDYTIVMTAAAADRMSFGCSDQNNLTYFTEAYFMNALSKTTDIEKAFSLAKEIVDKREKAGNVDKTSNPQIFVGKKIRKILGEYKGAKLVGGMPPPSSRGAKPPVAGAKK